MMMNIHRVTAWESSQQVFGFPVLLSSVVCVRVCACSCVPERERPAPQEGGREEREKEEGCV